MSIFWLQQTMADVPTDNAWLCANETLRLSEMKFAKRRNDWRLGRWTAKCAIAAYLSQPTAIPVLRSIEICPTASGAPEPIIAGQRLPCALSLSHSNGTAMAAVASSGVAVGCDLERIEPRINAFVTDYFSPEEQLLIQQASFCDRPALVTLLWCAKESALKALLQGLRLDTRSIRVDIGGGRGIPGNVAEGWQMASEGIQHPPCKPGKAGWRALQVFSTNADRTFYGWWRATSDFVWTIVAGALLLPPILLNSRLQGGE